MNNDNITRLIDIARNDDDFDFAFRMLLIDPDCDDSDLAYAFDDAPAHATIALARSMRTLADSLTRDAFSRLLMQFSLCPMHAIDFAICFDDDDAECAAIRSIFPTEHDT